jgi:3-keto-L-gulonate-6-phosphate decarboxylase
MGVSRSLQVAVDDPSLDGLEEVLGVLVEEGVDRIEAGTPLLTTYGVSVIERFAAYVPRDKIYADVKCVDLAYEQMAPYFASGVLHLSIHACLELSQAEWLLKLAGEHHASCYVSTLGFPDAKLLERVRALREIGLTRFVFHGEGLSQSDALSRAIAKYQICLEVAGIDRIVAGGITEKSFERIPERALIDGIIVGRGVLKSLEPRKSVQGLLRCLRDDKT